MKSNQEELVAEVQKLMERLVENAQPHAEELREKVDVLVAEGHQKLTAAWNEAHGSLMDRTESLRDSMNVILEDVVQKMEQSTERILGTSSEALKAKVRKDIQEFRHNMQRQLQSRLRQAKIVMQQVVRKLSSYNEALQNSFLNDFRRAFADCLQGDQISG
uniref:Uncharacterized protein n=1 Tax=Sphaerodactylus townsendi TaxID=933632 RepID=A0ACB8FSF5_9SAUR